MSVQVEVGAFVGRVAIPLAYLQTSARDPLRGDLRDRGDRADLGNVMFEALGRVDLDASSWLLLGGGLAPPTATHQLDDAVPASEVHGYFARAYAWRSSFRNAAAWQEHSFAIWASAEYHLDIPWLSLSAAAGVPVFIPTNSRVGGPLGRGTVEVMMALEVAVALRIVDLVDVGVAFLAVAIPSGAYGRRPASAGLPVSPPDDGQTALTAFVRTDEALDSPIGGGFEMLFYLDGFWGPTGDASRYWGARLFLTARIDS